MRRSARSAVDWTGAALDSHLDTLNRRCVVLQSDQRVHVPMIGLYTYPDVTVVCGKPEVHTKDPLAILNPLVILEVISESTRDYDRGAKFDHYRTIPSLMEVLFVEQSERRIELRRRQEVALWTFSWVHEGRLALPSLGIELAFDDICADLDLLDEEPA